MPASVSPATTISTEATPLVPTKSWTVPTALRRPRTRMPTRSQIISTSGRIWVLKNTVFPSSLRPSMISRTSRLPMGSSPDMGSSRMTKAGSLINACAKPIQNPGLSGSRGEQAQEQFNGGGLASPVMPQKSEDLALVHLQVQAIQCHDTLATEAETKLFGQPVCANRGHLGLLLPYTFNRSFISLLRTVCVCGS